MAFQDLFNFFNFIQPHTYIILFLIMLVEGPIITAVAAYASSLGYFNIWMIFLISVLGNLIPDILFYWIGRSSRVKSVEFFINKYFLSENSVKSMEKNLHLHFGKTFLVTKLCPMLPIPGILLSGFIRISFLRFIIVDIFFNLLYSVIFIIIGYIFGFAINNIFKYFKIGQYSFLGILVLVAFVYFIISRIKINQKEDYNYRKIILKKKKI